MRRTYEKTQSPDSYHDDLDFHSWSGQFNTYLGKTLNSVSISLHFTSINAYHQNFSTAKDLAVSPSKRCCRLAFSLNRAISVTINDGDWHHICTTWDNADGSWAFFKDGVAISNGNSFKAGHIIPSGGSLVLGQEQITDKTFEPRPFIGELGNFNIWNEIVSAIEVSQMSKRCLNGKGSVLHWNSFRFGINGKVKIVKPSSCTPNAFLY